MTVFSKSVSLTESSLLPSDIFVSVMGKIMDDPAAILTVSGIRYGLLPFSPSSRVQLPRLRSELPVLVNSIHSFLLSLPLGLGIISVMKISFERSPFLYFIVELDLVADDFFLLDLVVVFDLAEVFSFAFFWASCSACVIGLGIMMLSVDSAELLSISSESSGLVLINSAGGLTKGLLSDANVAG